MNRIRIRLSALAPWALVALIAPAASHAAAAVADGAAVGAAQVPDYPDTVCPVSGQELGSMGEPFDVLHGTRLVRLCCAGCETAFRADPDAHLAKLNAAD